jgi:hypothetical protein
MLLFDRKNEFWCSMAQQDNDNTNALYISKWLEARNLKVLPIKK